MKQEGRWFSWLLAGVIPKATSAVLWRHTLCRRTWSTA